VTGRSSPTTSATPDDSRVEERGVGVALARVLDPCKLGWVESPYTPPQYQRCGLASAGLAALRREHPRLSWHTLGGHFRASPPFWAARSAT
jgi:hypothetical protein